MILDLIGYIIQRQVEVRGAHFTPLAINQEGFARYRS